MTDREQNYLGTVERSLSMNDAELRDALGELKAQAEDEVSTAAADMSSTVGEMMGKVDLALQANERDMAKPVAKVADAVTTALTDSYRDLESAGYIPQVYYADVQADLSDPDQLGTFLKRYSPASLTCVDAETGQAVPCGSPDANRTLDFPVSPPPANGPASPPAAPPSPDCFPAGPLDPSNPSRLICTKPDGGTAGGGPIPAPEPVPEPIPSGGTCPAPEPPQFVCPAPVIVLPPPVNPADLKPGEPSPGTQPPPEPVCPDQPDVVVNVAPPNVEVKLPDPAEQPRFRFKVLDPAIQGPGALNLDAEDGCDTLNGACDKWDGIVNAVGGGVQDVADLATGVFGRWISNRLNVAQTTAGPVLNLAFSLFSDVKDDSQEAFTARITAAQFSQVRLLHKMVESNFGKDAACAMAPAAAAAAAVGIAQELAFDFSYFVTPFKYESQYIFPVYIPEQPCIDAMWLGDRITDEQHECLTRAHGNLPNLHRICAEEKRERPNANEWIDLWRRGRITEDRLFTEMRRLGWLDRNETANKIVLSEAIPTFGDVIRFMVRDTENAAAVAQGELDKGFEQNFAGQLKAWATANGVSEDLARRYWRAHWQWISPTQGYEMIHRLRPGVVDEKLVTTADDVRKVLEINDVAPAFLDRLIAISYSPLTRVDVRRAYEIGVLDEDDVRNAYLDLGYNESNADTLTQFTVAQKEQKEARAVKVWSLASIATAYKDATIDRSFAFSKARTLLPSDEATAQFLFDVEVKADAEFRKRCLAALKKRFIMGEFDTLRAQDEVENVVGDRGRAVKIVNGWECERSSRRKEVAAGTLCKWMGQGIIDQPTYIVRLANLGYTEDDARRMLASCGQEIFEKERRRALSEAKRNLDEYRKRQAELKAAIKEYEKKLAELEKKYGQCQPNGVHA